MMNSNKRKQIILYSGLGYVRQGDSQASTSENLKSHLTFLVSKQMHALCTAG